MMDIQHGYLASRAGIFLPLQVLGSDDGFYIGTWQNGPYTRESIEFFPDRDTALRALNTSNWTQFQYP